MDSPQEVFETILRSWRVNWPIWIAIGAILIQEIWFGFDYERKDRAVRDDLLKEINTLRVELAELRGRVTAVPTAHASKEHP